MWFSRSSQAVSDDITRRQLETWPKCNERLDRLTERFVCDANHGTIDNAIKFIDGVLDLARCHLLAACLDDVVHPRDEVEEAFVVGAKQIAGAQYAFSDDRAIQKPLFGFRWTLPVSTHHVTTSHNQFARRSIRQSLLVRIDKPVLLVCHAASDAAWSMLDFVRWHVTYPHALREPVHRE